MQEQQQIGLLCIATNRYKQFVQPLIDGIKKHFLIMHDVTIFLFTDEFGSYKGDSRVKIQQHHIESYKFPEATMLRYAIFYRYSRVFEAMDYLFYTDIDMGYVGNVDESILGDIVAVQHPGFYKGGGSWESRPESKCYVPPEKRITYFAGGFSGGSYFEYMNAIYLMHVMIELDLANGITPVWHDESALNKYLSGCPSTKILDPSYCLVENMTLRKQWGIDHFKPKILALDKNHSEIRS